MSQQLTDAALAGATWAELLATLSRASGRPSRLIGVTGAVLASFPEGACGKLGLAEVSSLAAGDEPAEIKCTDSWQGVSLGVRAGPRRIGVIALELPVDQRQVAMLAAARVPMCIEAVRRDVHAVARGRSKGWLIEELRLGSSRDAADLLRAAERHDLRLDRPHTAAAFAYEGLNRTTWMTALNWIERPVFVEGNTGWTVLPVHPAGELSRIRARLQGMVGDDRPVLAVSGSSVDDIAETARSFREAGFALALARRRGDDLELRFDQLGVTALLFLVPTKRLRDFVDEYLGAIRDRPDLLDTLEAWILCGRSRAAVGTRLNIHRNSVGYRMGRITELLGVDLLDPEQLVQMRAALLANEVLATLEFATSPYATPAALPTG